ncbi:MAG: VOC family protein [Bacteroidia bacterium]
MQAYSFLSFSGNCREAMMFYKKCLGGTLQIRTVGESPKSGTMPAKMKKVVLDARLTKDKMVLLGSDLIFGRRETGNAVSIMLDCKSEEEAKAIYKRLSSGGKKVQPLVVNYNGALSGDLTDKYGNHWIIYYGNLSVSNKQ